jgi:4-hydroxybenzoate polyprenyltransferase
MMNAFNRAFFAHLLLAVAALLMTALTSILAGTAAGPYYYAIAFFSALLIYRLAYYGLPHKLTAVSTIDRILVAVSMLSIAYAVFFILYIQVAGLVFTMLACLAYFTRLSNWKGMRSVTFIKSFWLAGVWSLVTVWIPLQFSMDKNVILLLGERFLFMLSICIIYNLRDYSHDTEAGINTLLQKVGVPLTKLICIGFLALDALLIYIHHYPLYISNALIVSVALTGLMVVAARRNGHWLYYTLLIDGSMIVQYLLVVFSVHNSVH